MINLYLLKITMAMLQLQIKLMILIILLEVRNLKNVTKLTIIITTKIMIEAVTIRKSITPIKVVLIVKSIAPRRHQPQKKLFPYLVTSCLVKVQPFNSAKVRCMYDHAKPTLRDFDLDHIMSHCGIIDPNSDTKSSQIARDITDESKVHLNRYGTIAFANNYSNFLSEYY